MTRIRRVAIVGTVVLDVIRSADGTVHHALGGIAHGVAALSALVEDGVEVVPVCRVDPGLEDRLEAAWGPRGNVSRHGWVPAPGPTPRSHLSYGRAGAQADRTERLEGAPEPLGPGDVEVAGDADLVLVNAITGRDLTTAALESVAATGGHLYLDFHGRAFRPDARGHRRLERPPDWRRWIDVAGFLQCNEAEAGILAGLEPGEVVAAGGELLADPRRGRAVADLAGTLVTGPGRTEAVAVTCGRRGAVAWVRGGRRGGKEEVERLDVAAPSVEVVDPTGAGDVFGAACALAWASGEPPEAAIRRGVQAGSAACRAAGPPSPGALRRAVDAADADAVRADNARADNARPDDARAGDARADGTGSDDAG